MTNGPLSTGALTSGRITSGLSSGTVTSGAVSSGSGIAFKTIFLSEGTTGIPCNGPCGDLISNLLNQIADLQEQLQRCT